MKIKSFLLAAVLIIVSSGKALAQLDASESRSKAPPLPVAPVDASFVPHVESKTQALEVVSVTREDPVVHIDLKNTSDKRIYSLRYSYHKSGQSVMLAFVNADEKTFIAPGELYEYDYPFVPTSILLGNRLSFRRCCLKMARVMASQTK